mmetsp:Transcript_64854/g.154847  ORF Transcript_64854/g.154847 Transcript_64854/m.154847 type:complete len:238 (-) Transcript_64854:495-1208(-)
MLFVLLQHCRVLCLLLLQRVLQDCELVLCIVPLRFARAKLVAHHLYLVLEVSKITFDVHMLHAHLDELPITCGNALLQLLILRLSLDVLLPLFLHVILLGSLPAQVRRILFAKTLQLVVSNLHVLNSFFPLRNQLSPFLMQLSEDLSSLVHFDLLGLCVRNLVRELLLPLCVLISQFLNGHGQLPHLRLVGPVVLLQCSFIFFFLLGCDGPLFKLLLVPIHFQLELVELLIATHELI